MNEINQKNKITIPVSNAAAGQRVVKIVQENKTTFLPEGLGGKIGNGVITARQSYTPMVDHIYYHKTYDTVCYLDADNSITGIGYNAENISLVDLWITQLDLNTAAGDIVLQCGDNVFVVPVTAELVKHSLILNNPVSGIISVVRLVNDARDTFDGTVIATDWQVA